MSAMGRFLPVAILAPERPLLGESRHSSKEFICSVRPSLNDRYRLKAALQLTTKKSRRQASTGQEPSFTSNYDEKPNYAKNPRFWQRLKQDIYHLRRASIGSEPEELIQIASWLTGLNSKARHRCNRLQQRFIY